MGRFRKKPVEIEAMRFVDNESADAILRWAGTPPVHVLFGPAGDGVADALGINTLEGTMRADLGDWIIRGVKGEFYPCKPDIFEASYDPVED